MVIVQSDLDALVKCSKDWHITFHNEKCKVMICKNKSPNINFNLELSMVNNATNERQTLEETTIERDLGIFISNDLKWESQAKHAAKKANSILGMLKRTFIYWDLSMVKTLYTTFVRPHLEYASSAWCLYRKKDIHTIEQIQRRATKLVPNIKHLTYEKRLEILGLTTLKERRERGDLIQYFKIANKFNLVNWYHPNKSMKSIESSGPAGNIRGNKHRLARQFTRNCDQREHFYSNRVVPLWNELSNEVVAAKTVNEFKNLIDKNKF